MRRRKMSDSAVEFILTRCLKDLGELTTIEVARNIGVNRLILSLFFFIDRKISLPNFLLREKIHKAFFILEQDMGKSIEELSTDLGFLKTEDFYSEFEKYFAITPEKFRDLRKKVSGFKNL